MRITAGYLKNRVINISKLKTTRPMQDKVRIALFSIIFSVENKTILDVYAGSGIIGFEALSRGALKVEAIEGSKLAAQNIIKNSTKLEVNKKYILHNYRIESWLDKIIKANKRTYYDIIIADPPYKKINTEILNKLVKLLKNNGLMIVSHSSKIKAPILDNIIVYKTKIFGDSSLSFYEKKI